MVQKKLDRSAVRALFASSVKRWRNHRGLTQEELAERADLHRTYISDVERGARNLSLESIDKLARALEVSVPRLFLPLETAPESGENKNPPGQLSSRLVNIILVEDNPDDVAQTLDALTRAGFANTVRVANDGIEALDLFFGRGALAEQIREAQQLMVLLDLYLPKVSGLEVLRQLKADKRTREVPVVVITGADKDQDILECRQLGAEAFIAKPVSLQGLSKVTPALSLLWALIKPATTLGT